MGKNPFGSWIHGCWILTGSLAGAPPRSFELRGRIEVRQIHLPPSSNFSSDLGHLIPKILENLKNGTYSEKFRQKSAHGIPLQLPHHMTS